MTEVQIYRYDFTFQTCEEYKVVDREKLIRFLSMTCKNWVFQLEAAPTTGKLHFQGRVSLKVKMRGNTLAEKSQAHSIMCHWSPTSNRCLEVKEFDYVMKADTRVEGPWADRETALHKIEAPKKTMKVIKMEDEGLKPWQKTIVDMCNIYDDRSIDIIFDRTGNIGKSSLLKYLKHPDHALAHKVESTLRNGKDLMQACYSVTEAKGIRKAFIVDFPKGISHRAQNELWTCLEEIKNGFLYDTRYKYKDLDMDEPRIFVFTNTLPPVYLMSKDRWKYWFVCQDILYEYIPGPDDYTDPVYEAQMAEARRASVQKRLAKEIAINNVQMEQLKQAALPSGEPPANEPNTSGPTVPTDPNWAAACEPNPVLVDIPGIKPFWLPPGTGVPIKLSNLVRSPTRIPADVSTRNTTGIS